MKTSEITDILFSMQDSEYKRFHAGLMPGINVDRIIGVRVPELKKYAKKLYGTKTAEDFLQELPHYYYEENNLHAFLIGRINGFDTCISEVERFLPYVDNWATCDGLRPACFGKNKEKLLPYIEKWLLSDRTYTVRFGIEMLMVHFLDEDFDEKYPEAVSKVKSGEYYVDMMTSWYFATALAKQWDKTVRYIEEKRLSTWTHNKTIQKCVESYRISKVQKEYLKSLKIR